MLKLQWMPSTAGGWFDLDADVLYRRPQDAIETNKHRTPSPIPPRLRPHLERWKRLSTQYVIEYDGKPIASQLRRAWNGARAVAGLGADVVPHVLRHSCAALMLKNRVSTEGSPDKRCRHSQNLWPPLRSAVNVRSKRPGEEQKLAWFPGRFPGR